MAEPNTSGISITALFIAILGPLAGQYSLIVMAALAGAMWPLSTMEGTTRAAGAFFLARIVFTAIFITGSLSWLLSSHLDLPVYESMAIAAFAIGALGNGWGRVFRGLRDGLAAMLRGFSGGRSYGGDNYRGRDDE